ncbi:hypothetical protein FACS1894202_09540 [Clostridia bacterium]|nr:hypothetical protein FACS1894202_09540 [Clostridia bacterium]
MTYAVIAGHVSWLLQQVVSQKLSKAARLFIVGRGAEDYCGYLQKTSGVAAMPNPARSHLERADVIILCEEQELTFNPKDGAEVSRCYIDNKGNILYNEESSDSSLRSE